MIYRERSNSAGAFENGEPVSTSLGMAVAEQGVDQSSATDLHSRKGLKIICKRLDLLVVRFHRVF